MYHPWRHLRELSYVGVFWRDRLPDDDLGQCLHEHDAVVMSRRQTQAERRSTITHELIHLERGRPCVGFEGHEERLVEREAARRLIPLEALIDALRWSQDEHELAEELWVDVDTVKIRLRHLTPAERRFISAELDRREAESGDDLSDLETSL